MTCSDSKDIRRCGRRRRVCCIVVFLLSLYRVFILPNIALYLWIDRALTLLYRAFILVRIRAFIVPLKWMFFR